jgi:hypothetical protein
LQVQHFVEEWKLCHEVLRLLNWVHFHFPLKLLGELAVLRLFIKFEVHTLGRRLLLAGEITIVELLLTLPFNGGLGQFT